MPVHNNFHAHIVWTDSHSKVPPRKSAHIKECAKQISNDGKTVTCYIAVETGCLFAGTWWSNDRDPATAQRYTVVFMRDGESAHFAVFDRKAAAQIQGTAGEGQNDDGEDNENRPYYFMFRVRFFLFFWCTTTNNYAHAGDDNATDRVPDDIGTLQIIIRKPPRQDDDTDGESGESESDSESAGAESDNNSSE